MGLPFTREDFIGVLVGYNEAVWPLQILMYAAGLFVLARILKRGGSAGGGGGLSGRLLLGFLGFFWVWTGAAYHLGFFSRINKAAFMFGAFSIVQGILFCIAAFGRESPVFRFNGGARGLLGAALTVYALLVYPLIGILAGHGYPAAPLFGVAPCPTTIFTFGVLLWSEKRVPVWLLAIPFLWSLVGGSATILLGIPEDVGLPVAGIAGGLFLAFDWGRTGKPAAAARRVYDRSN